MTVENNDSVRWKQRYENFKRAFARLDEVSTAELPKLSLLEKEGMVQRFEYTFELAWKVLKDKMESDGILLDQISPKAIIRQAFHAKYIENVELWLDMITDRNLMSHTYDFLKFDSILQVIQKYYVIELKKLLEKLNF